MKLLNKLERSYSFWFLVLMSLFFFLLRWPSLVEPYWYADEGIYQAVGILIKNGQHLYSGAWENKPPLLLLIYALLNSDQFLIRALSLIFGLFSIIFFYFICQKLFPKAKLALNLSTFIFTLLFGINLIEGNIANAENFMLLPILIGIFLFLFRNSIPKLKQRWYVFSIGLALSIAFLIKVVAIFDFLTIIIFLLFTTQNFSKKFFKDTFLPILGGFITPIVITMIYFLTNNTFNDFLDAFVLRNVGYVGYSNSLLIPQGLLITKLIILSIFILMLFVKRKSFSQSVLFILIWFGISIFNVYFSQRPYIHYLILLLPSFCLLIAMIITQKKNYQILSIIGLLAFLLIVVNSFDLKFKKVLPYYSNLVNFCLDRKDVSAYQSFFDKRTPKDYLLANYLRIITKKNDGILIWGNNAQVYKLSDRKPIFRYTVAYHVLSFPNGVEEMNDAIKKQQPKYIVIMPDVPAFPLSLTNYMQRATIEDIIVYEKIL